LTGYLFLRIIVFPKTGSTGEKMLEYAVFMFCLIGCGLTCHALGKREGIESTIEHLVDAGMLELEEE